MIRALVSASVRLRGLIIGLAATVLAVGIVTLPDAPADVYPEFTPPYVEIQTESLGLSASEVEQFLTVPLEADLLNGVEGVDVIRSSSTPGLSSIVLVFQQGFNVYKGRQLVQERLTQLGGAAFPNVSKPPTMLPPLSSSSRVMMIGLSSEELTPIQQSVIARWTIRPRLMGVQGVANVAVWGMRDQQIQVQVDPEKLRDEKVTLNQVIRTAGNAQIASPVSYLEASVPGTGGFLETPSQRLPIRNVFDNIASPESLGKVPVEDTAGRLRLTDVAKVTEAHQPLIGDAIVDDGNGLVLVVEKFPGADTAEVTKNVESELAGLKAGLEGMKSDTTIFRPADYVDAAEKNLGVTGGIASVLLIVALIALVRRWRQVFIAVVAIPTSLVSAALVLDWTGQGFNAISIAGLVLALTVVIDAAVTGADALTRSRGVAEATRAVGRPLAYATLIAVLVALPLLVLEGRPGAFLEPLVSAYLAAIVAGAVVVLTLTPALGTVLPPKERREDGRLGTRYRSLLPQVLGVPTVAAALVASVLVALVVPFLSRSVVPDLKDQAVLVRLESPTGTSNVEMTRIATSLSSELRDLDGVANVGASVGRAVTGDRIVDVNSGEIVVKIDQDADYDKTLDAIRRTSDGVDGATADVSTYLEDRVRTIGALLSGQNTVKGDGLDVFIGTDQPIRVRVYGQDPKVLKSQADKVAKIVAGVEGVRDTAVEAPEEQPTLEIEVDLDKAQKVGVKPGDVRRAEAILLQGILVGSVFDDQKVFDVIVQGNPSIAKDTEAVRSLLIDRPDGGHVRLNSIADIRAGSTPTVIKRDEVSRKLDVTLDVDGRSVEDVADEIESKLKRVDMPLEYHAKVIDLTVDDEINKGQSVAFILAGLLAVLLLMQASVRSWRLAGLAYLALPSALLGGVVALLILGDGITIATGAGLLAVLGLAIRNTLVALDPIGAEGKQSAAARRDDVLERAHDRLGPVVSSTVAIAAVMLPFALFGSRAGLEILQPMAIVILGGLITTAAHALLVLPALSLAVPAPDPDEDAEILEPAHPRSESSEKGSR
ncbi:efflux RND transporter permease subunit [Aeromicrobium sp.]|uniref:efflux RND transporter permease subunit n=1 Tax=Aeromicrobium sp. TaxID=1871063 RepID=UPI003C4B7054